MRYLQVKTTDGKNIRLRVIREDVGTVMGVEVRKDGDEVVPKGSADRRIHFIGKDCISWQRELRMNMTYGELEAM